jgi:hypothetical protein
MMILWDLTDLTNQTCDFSWDVIALKMVILWD